MADCCGNCQHFESGRCIIGLLINEPVIMVNPWDSCELFLRRDKA